MKTKIIEATQNKDHGPNWGKILIAEFTEEWEALSAIDGLRMLRSRGWGPKHRFVLDLQTGEGAMFPMSGLASADLNKHRIWVCPLFEPLLEWLYAHPMPLDELPALVEVPDAPASFQGYRRPGVVLEGLGEAMHTAFRKAADGPQAHQVWKLIDEMDPLEWAKVVGWVAETVLPLVSDEA